MSEPMQTVWGTPENPAREAHLEGDAPSPSVIRAMKSQDALNDVRSEIVRAVGLHGPMASRHEAYAILFEEVDEFWDEVKLNPAKMTEQNVLQWKRRMRTELVQIAAMAVRAIADLEL